jgi:hypothetical protein
MPVRVRACVRASMRACAYERERLRARVHGRTCARVCERSIDCGVRAIIARDVTAGSCVRACALVACAHTLGCTQTRARAHGRAQALTCTHVYAHLRCTLRVLLAHQREVGVGRELAVAERAVRLCVPS